jgi:hypothetical protein
MLKRCGYIFVSAWVLLTCGHASATCYWDCDLNFMTADCQDSDATFTAGDPIYVWAKCDETCCAPPPSEGEEQDCSVESSAGADPSDLTILNNLLEPVAGEFTVSEHACEGVNLLLFEGELSPGNYVAKLEGELDGAEQDVERAFSVKPGAAAPSDEADEGGGDDEGGCSVSADAERPGRAWLATSLLLLLLAGTLLLARTNQVLTKRG